MSVGPNLDEKITLKEAQRRHEAYLDSHYIERSFLIKTKAFTAAKLAAYEKSGALHAVKDGGAVRFRGVDIARIIESETAAKKAKKSGHDRS